MPTLSEGKLEHTFPDNWEVTKYDDWAFYRKQLTRFCRNKGVDFLAYEPQAQALWLIELKDYRQFPRTKDKTIKLWDDIAIKVRDTLAGLMAARINATVEAEQHYAAQALQARLLHVVFHLEQPRTHTKLFPRAYDPADIQQKLKQIIKPIDAHPKVVELSTMDKLPWHAASRP